MKRPRLTACLLVAISAFGTLASAHEEKPSGKPRPTQEQDIETLRNMMIKSGEAFNASDPDAIMAPYARDVILSYPGVPDMDYETLAKAYAGLRTRKDVVEKTSPTIEEVLVSGDMGIIRVMWTTNTTEVATGRQSTRQMKDLQVWRRESDGSWKFIRGMHFRIPPPAKPAN